MPIISFTQKEIKRSILLDPGWYTIQIDEVGEKPSKDNQSTNYPISATVIRNADTGTTEGCEGVPLDWQFNSKALSFAVGYIKAITGQDEIPTDQRIELKNTIGKVIDVFVKRGEWQGNAKNEASNQYRVTKQQ